MNKSEIFEKVPVKRAVLMQIVPAILSQMIALLYNLADTYFVGLLNDPKQTAAVTISYAPFLMLTALSNLFGVGGASAISRALGAKQGEEAKNIASISFWLGFVVSLFYSLLFTTFARPLLMICGADATTYDVAYGYAKWTIMIGGLAVVLNVLLANLVRAEGSAGVAAGIVSFGGLLNILLDPILILPQGFHLGAQGAGLATFLSNLIATVLFLIYICMNHKKTVLNVELRRLRTILQYIWSILSVGFPSAIQYALTVVAVAAQTKFVSHYQAEAIAALGITKKLDQLPLYFSIGVANGLMPFLAYNFSAGNRKRRKQAFVFGAGISVAFSTFCFVIYEIFAPYLIACFIGNQDTIAYGAAFLRCMVTAMPFMALCYPMIIQFQAMGKVKEALVCSVLRKGILDIPLLFLMDAIWPLYGCMVVQPIVDFVSLVVAIYMYRRCNAKESLI